MGGTVRPWVLLLTLLAACKSDDVAGSPGVPDARLDACEPQALTPVSIAPSERTALEQRGGFVSTLRVDQSATRNDGVTFRRITDALAEARRIRTSNPLGACRITIVVPAGTYVGSTAGTDTLLEALPLRIDMRDVTLRGAYAIATDSLDRALGPASTAASAATTLVARPALTIVGGTTQTGVSEPLILVNSENGVGGDGAIIERFVLRSGHAATDTVVAGKGVLTLRANNVIIRGNSFEGNFTERVDLRGGSAVVQRNYSSGPGDTCDICLAGPGVFTVDRNTLTQGGIPGVLIVPATQLPVPPGVSQFVPPAVAEVQALITANEISGHQRVPVGTGIRIATVGINVPNVQGTSRVEVANNTLRNNRFGFIVEAGFPVAGSLLRGDAVVNVHNNAFLNSCQTDLYVSFARHTTGLGLANTPYLRNSTVALEVGPDAPWARAWFSHPDGFGNTLVVNRATIANDRVAPYNPTKPCS